jgi:hypothetical protein
VWVLDAACAARQPPPPWDPLVFENMALRMILDTSSNVSNTEGSISYARSTAFISLSRPPTVRSDEVVVAPGVTLSCEVRDDMGLPAANGIQLVVTGTASIVAHVQQDFVARCNLGDVEVVVVVTLLPS